MKILKDNEQNRSASKTADRQELEEIREDLNQKIIVDSHDDS